MPKNFTLTEKWLGNPGSRVASADIGVAFGRGLGHLLEHFKLCRYKLEGFFNVPVGSRILESALMLHLLRRTGGDLAWQRQLQDYLCVKLHEADPVSAMAAKAVLKLPSGIEPSAAVAAIAKSAEYGLQRKRALLTMLLVELGVIPFADARILPQEYTVGAAHRFSRLYAAALRVMHCRYQPLDIANDLEFLTGAQSANGSWEQQVLITLVVLLAVGAAHPAFERGFCYLQSVRRNDGGMPFIDNQDIWVSCVAGLALQAADCGAQPEIHDQLAQFIVNRQHENGGWSFTDGVTQTDTDVTANCVQMLCQHNGARYAVNIQRALHYLARLQRPDGGYPTYEREGESEATMTANVLLAQNLAATHDPDLSAKMLQAARYLANRQRPDGSFEMSWSRSEAYSIFRVLWALDVYPRTQLALSQSGLFNRSFNRLIQTQRPDGGWGQSPGLASDALSTAYAVGALCLLSRQHLMEPHTISRAVAFLLSQQDPETGAFYSVPDVAGPRPIPFNTPLLSTIWCLLALSFVESRTSLFEGKPTHGLNAGSV
jgi:squalene-hopene/tetraprenyl-beta-curcumene cyclase